MTLSTALWLAQELGYTEHGEPTAQKLLDAATSLYFAASYLQHLSHFAGPTADLTFMVRAYRTGAKEALAQQPAQLSDNMQDGMLGAPVTGGRAHPQIGGSQDDLLFSVSYVKAYRYFAKLIAIESGGPAPFQPMHVVRAGESVDSVAVACGTSTSAIYALNPDIKEGAPMAPGDCIAIPCTCLPRLHYTLPGDTLMRCALGCTVVV